MSSKKNGKWNLFSLIVFAVLVVSVVMAIVGICIAWTSTTSSSQLLGTGSTTYVKISNWFEQNNAQAVNGFAVNAAFAIIAVVSVGLAAITYVLSKYINKKVVKFVALAFAVLAVAAGIVTIITAYTFVNGLGSIDFGFIGKGSCGVAAGPWLVFVFAVVGGIATALGSFKK